MSINTPKGIISQFGEDLYAIKSEKMSHSLQLLRNEKEVKSCFSFGETHHVTLKGNIEANEYLRLFASRHNIAEWMAEKIEPTIEDCFIKLMGK